jgi:hypothetical protein
MTSFNDPKAAFKSKLVLSSLCDSWCVFNFVVSTASGWPVAPVEWEERQSGNIFTDD